MSQQTLKTPMCPRNALKITVWLRLYSDPRLRSGSLAGVESGGTQKVVEMGMREERKCILWSAREVGLI